MRAFPDKGGKWQISTENGIYADARDLELQREIQEACEVFLNAAGDDRPMAKGHYLKLLRTSLRKFLNVSQEFQIVNFVDSTFRNANWPAVGLPCAPRPKAG